MSNDSPILSREGWAIGACVDEYIGPSVEVIPGPPIPEATEDAR